MSKTIRFNKPPNHNLVLPGGRVVKGGQTASVSDEVALELASAPYTDVSIVRVTTPRQSAKPASKQTGRSRGKSKKEG